MARALFGLLVLAALVSGKGAIGGKRRPKGQKWEHGQCDNGEGDAQGPVSVREGTVHHSCIVTNRDTQGALVRVMCGGGDKPKKDVDRATYAYIAPQSQALVLDGMCPRGHRCHLCGVTMQTAQKGDDVNGQKFLEQQDYECGRFCKAVLYQHEDFNGHIQTFSHNAPDLTETLMEGKISAIKIVGYGCQLRLWQKKNLEGAPVCTFTSGKNMEVAVDMDELIQRCGDHDKISSMSIRPQEPCGASMSAPGATEDCPRCKNNVPALNCCVKPTSHGSGFDRADALKRLFKAMASVLEE